MRWAWVRGGKPEVIERFLPHNYKVVFSGEDAALISGEDSNGWTLDDYVIPRLSSGLISCVEVKDRTMLDMLTNVWGDE